MNNILNKILTISFLLSLIANVSLAKDEDTSGFSFKEPHVRAINEKLKTQLPEVSFILKQEIEVKGGKLISKKVLLNGVRVEEVKLKNIDPNSIRIDKFIGSSYYFITIFSKEKKADVDYGYEETKTTSESVDLDDYNVKGLENNGSLDHFCLSVNSKEDAQEIVNMIKAMIAAG